MTQILVRYSLIFDTPQHGVKHFTLLVVTTLLIAAGGYIINDYFDVKIDRINKPHKVWIGKTISRRSALLVHQLFSAAGILLAFFDRVESSADQCSERLAPLVLRFGLQEKAVYRKFCSGLTYRAGDR